MPGMRKPVITNPNATTTPISLKAAKQRQGRPPGNTSLGQARKIAAPFACSMQEGGRCDGNTRDKGSPQNTAAAKRQKAECSTEKRIGRYTAATEPGRLVEWFAACCRICGVIVVIVLRDPRSNVPESRVAPARYR